MKKSFKKLAALVLAGTMVFSLCACGEKGGNDATNTPAAEATKAPAAEATKAPEKTEDPKTDTPAPTLAPIKLTISLPSAEEHLEANAEYDQARAELNEYLNADITWEWISDSVYYDDEHLGLKMSTGDVADVVISGKSATFLKAAEEGLFWDIAPYIDEFPNLATIPQATRENASHNGKMYGLPRSRTLARNGLGYRVDWLNNLGLAEPTDWDSFADMLYKFTYNDPDGNGVDDTCGLAIDSWSGVWNIMMTWFGVPNEWGIDANGELIYKVMTPEYKTAIKAFRELYEQGVINNGSNGIPDFLEVGPGKARDTLLRTGLCGCGVQVLDDQRKVETYFESEGLADPDEPIYTLQGAVDTGLGILCYPTTGMNNLIAISTVNIKTEEQLKQVLSVLDKINDGVALNLIEYGWEGKTYELDENGYISLFQGDDLTAHGVTSTRWNYGFNQVPAYFTAESNARPVTVAPASTVVTKLEQELYAKNIQYCVPNYGASYSSQYYAYNGADLDKIINEAQQAFIRGEIDEAAFDAEIQRWFTAGGYVVTNEMNELYKKSK
ncbi:MAG: extracellular solute-binding protein [Lachnospiraceae bacterium]|nr:extracellular solute-binding protein [Lachnospiraceae bacterium]